SAGGCERWASSPPSSCSSAASSCVTSSSCRSRAEALFAYRHPGAGGRPPSVFHDHDDDSPNPYGRGSHMTDLREAWRDLLVRRRGIASSLGAYGELVERWSGWNPSQQSVTWSALR